MLSGDDAAAIRNLYARYNHLADGNDPVAYGDCYLPDGKLHSNGRTIGTSQAEIVEFRRSIMMRGSRRRHETGSIWLTELETNRIQGRSYTQSFDIGADGSLVRTHMGSTEDLVALAAPGDWRFARRELRFDWIDERWQ